MHHSCSLPVQLLEGGYKRFRRDGHQCVIEDVTRLHYEREELAFDVTIGQLLPWLAMLGWCMFTAALWGSVATSLLLGWTGEPPAAALLFECFGDDKLIPWAKIGDSRGVRELRPIKTDLNKDFLLATALVMKQIILS